MACVQEIKLVIVHLSYLISGYADYGDDKEDVDNNKGEPMLHQPEGEDAVDDPDDDDNEEQQCEGSGVQDGNCKYYTRVI